MAHLAEIWEIEEVSIPGWTLGKGHHAKPMMLNDNEVSMTPRITQILNMTINN